MTSSTGWRARTFKTARLPRCATLTPLPDAIAVRTRPGHAVRAGRSPSLGHPSVSGDHRVPDRILTASDLAPANRARCAWPDGGGRLRPRPTVVRTRDISRAPSSSHDAIGQCSTSAAARHDTPSLLAQSGIVSLGIDSASRARDRTHTRRARVGSIDLRPNSRTRPLGDRPPA